MKYKCIQDYSFNRQNVMSAGDVIVLDDNNLYNVSTGLDFRDIKDYRPYICKCLEAITDEQSIRPCPKQEYKPNTDTGRFKAVTEEMLNIFERKNHDYGNSFEQSLNEFGLGASAIRLNDKMNRLKSLTKQSALVKDESIKDTLMDMANYAIMTIIWLDKQQCDSARR